MRVEAERQQLTAIVEDLWDSLLLDVSASRGVAAQDLELDVARKRGLPERAKAGLVDHAATHETGRPIGPPAILGRMFKNGEHGVKTGKGFYEWDGFKPVAGRDFSDVVITSSDFLLEV